jgi:hypothetical protein
VRFSLGDIAQALPKTQSECLDGREKKVTELLPYQYAGIPFSRSIGRSRLRRNGKAGERE